MQVHKVRSGDTLSIIALTYGVSLAQILQANPQIANPDLVGVGDQINIPGKGAGAGAARDNNSANTKPGLVPARNLPYPDLYQDAPWMFHVCGELGLWQKTGGAGRIEKYRSQTGLGDGDWCSIFVNWIMRQVGYTGTRSALAASWASWGVECQPRVGAIAVLNDGYLDAPRFPGNPWFHVTFFESGDAGGVTCIGGNQGGMVKPSYYLQLQRLRRPYPWLAQQARVPLATAPAGQQDPLLHRLTPCRAGE